MKFKIVYHKSNNKVDMVLNNIMYVDDFYFEDNQIFIHDFVVTVKKKHVVVKDNNNEYTKYKCDTKDIRIAMGLLKVKLVDEFDSCELIDDILVCDKGGFEYRYVVNEIKFKKKHMVVNGNKLTYTGYDKKIAKASLTPDTLLNGVVKFDVMEYNDGILVLSNYCISITICVKYYELYDTYMLINNIPIYVDDYDKKDMVKIFKDITC